MRSLAKGLTSTVVYKNYRSTRQKARKRCNIRFSNHCVKNVPIRNTSPYLVWMRENTDQKNSKYGHFSRSEYCQYLQCCWVSQSQQYTITIISQNSRYIVLFEMNQIALHFLVLSLVRQRSLSFLLRNYFSALQSWKSLNVFKENPLHKKWSFPLRISPVNVPKSAVSCGFGHIY